MVWTMSKRAVPVVLVLALVGCNNSKYAGTITGKVTYKGTPLPSGTVIFHFAGNRAELTQIKDGTYSIRLPRDVTGEAKIAVTTPPSRRVKMMPGMPAPPPSVPIPARYARPETSRLSCTIAGGDQTHDLDLK